MSNTPTAQLSAAGVSIWLDDLSRERITSGNLQALIAEKNVVGVTTNPTIFAGALTNGESYAAQVKKLAAAGADAEAAVFEITTDDVADACDIFRGVFDATNGVDGRVSIEAGLSLTWDKIVGSAGRSVSIEHFGASADYKTLFTKFGITTDAAVAAAKESIAAQ